MAYTTVTTTTSVSIFGRIVTAIDGMVTRYKQYRMYQKTLNSLSALTNRELDDLGLSRGSLEAAARESAIR